MKIFYVEWQVRDLYKRSKYFYLFSSATRHVDELLRAAETLKLTFESAPAVKEIEVEES